MKRHPASKTTVYIGIDIGCLHRYFLAYQVPTQAPTQII